MSGGHFYYRDSELKTEIFGWDTKITNQFEDMEISKLVWDVLDLIHDYDWYVSGDTCEETWLKKKKEFKKKWFKEKREDRVREIVDNAIDNLREEFYKTFDLEDEDIDDLCTGYYGVES